VNIVGNWLLVPRYGAVGAAISTAFSYIVFFSMRTFISLRYFKVNYGLKRIYIFTFLIFGYSLFLLSSENLLMNYSFGTSILILLVLSYYKDLREILLFNYKK
jgi:O-antigen/teichoic acid export membrane protein